MHLFMVQDDVKHLILHMNLLSLSQTRSITSETERRVRVVAGKYQERCDAHLSATVTIAVEAHGHRGGPQELSDL